MPTEEKKNGSASPETALMLSPAPAPLAAYEPKNFEQALAISTHLAKSGLLGALNSPEKVLMVMMTAAELGVPTTAALRGIHVIEGKVSLSADLKVGLCLRRKDRCVYFKCVETTDQQATYETLQAGAAEPHRHTFSIQDAQKAGLLDKDNWRKRPKTMLRHRCSSELATMCYPDIVQGLLTEDEAEEVGAPPTPIMPLNMSPGVIDAEVVQKPEPEPIKPGLVTEQALKDLCGDWRARLKKAQTTAEAEKVRREVKDKLDPGSTIFEEMSQLYQETIKRLRPGARTKAGAGEAMPTPPPPQATNATLAGAATTAAPPQQQELPNAPPRERQPGEDDA